MKFAMARGGLPRFSIPFLLLGLALVTAAVAARAQDSAFPSRHVTVIVSFPPGGSADFFARAVLNKADRSVKQSFIMEYRAGAGGIIGAKAVIAAAPDGYMLLASSVASVIVPPNLTTPPAYDPMKDLVPVATLATVPSVLVVRSSLGIKTFADFLKYAKAHPGKLNLATSGRGTISHLAGELLMRETGIKLVPIHYRGAPPAVTDLLGDHADVMFSDAPFFLQHIKAGKLVALAVGTPKRSPALPNVPTTAELGYPALVASNIYTLFAPAKTPPDILETLNRLAVAALHDPAVEASFAVQAAVAAPNTLQQGRALMEAEYKRWIPLVEAIGLKGH